MTDPIKEQLSACLDGELPEGELDLLLKQVGRDPKARASLGRYALIGEALRGQRPVAAPAGFAQRVSVAIEIEAAPAQVERPMRAPRWLRPVAGFAVAAGVAAVAVFTLQPAPETEAPYVAEIVADQSEAPPIDSADSYIVPTGTSSAGFVPATRLTNYVVAHSEYSTALGRRSMLSGVLSEDADEADASTDAEEPSTVVTQP
jgi:sigma-E factor negative regulatory protein RseA